MGNHLNFDPFYLVYYVLCIPNPLEEVLVLMVGFATRLKNIHRQQGSVDYRDAELQEGCDGPDKTRELILQP